MLGFFVDDILMLSLRPYSCDRSRMASLWTLAASREWRGRFLVAPLSAPTEAYLGSNDATLVVILSIKWAVQNSLSLH